MTQGYQALTEKEKQTLRLLLDGHDAKSMARHLGLSVHTINERLRDSRPKLSVSSSKAAARLLRQSESEAPDLVGAGLFGDAEPVPTDQQASQPSAEPSPKHRAAWAIGGLAMIMFFIAMLALSAPTEGPQASAGSSGAAAAQLPVNESAVTRAAWEWLALVDEGKWSESWAASGQPFRSLNTVEAWQSASEKARLPLGRVLSRKLAGEEAIPAPPNGYRLIRFRTDFANKSGALETLSLDREGDSWKVVGIYIE